ncbi:hypothetical protein K438DRAFT_1787775 [Mycena galopus ATCC 62051]|nr:hypothetical protein K438DRAFT_1787775 [Mycena galopus ATCC 62051]
MPATFDLKQVGKLFDDAISAYRDDTPDPDALEPHAVKWLKGARYQLMRDVEKAYYELERSRNKLMSQPRWALDPNRYLFLSASPPALLEPYRDALCANLETLLRDCGFKVVPHSLAGLIAFNIYFPEQPVVAAAPLKGLRSPLHVDVEDEFSRPTTKRGDREQSGTGVFAAGDFARLLADARVSARGDADSGGNIRRRHATPSVKEEKDPEYVVVERKVASLPHTITQAAQSIAAPESGSATPVAEGVQSASAPSTADKNEGNAESTTAGPSSQEQGKTPSLDADIVSFTFQVKLSRKNIFWILGGAFGTVIIVIASAIFLVASIEARYVLLGQYC